MIRRALFPSLIVFVFTSIFTFVIIYQYEIMRFLYPEYAPINLKVPFAGGFSSNERLFLDIIIVAVPTIPALITFIFELGRLKKI